MKIIVCASNTKIFLAERAVVRAASQLDGPTGTFWSNL